MDSISDSLSDSFLIMSPLSIDKCFIQPTLNTDKWTKHLEYKENYN